MWAHVGAPLLELRALRVCFPSVDAPPVLALDGLSLQVFRGEFVALLGPSGCGKSTALNAMAGLLQPDGGEVLFDGAPVQGLSPRVGYISQADNLLPWRTVLENVAIGLQLRGQGKQQRREAARALLASMGLSDFETNYPHELSGGMKKRVTIARTLATQPEILFMDEPFGPLDAFTKEKLQDDILALWESLGQTIVYVTHDLGEAISLSDRVLLLGGRPGQLCAEYPITLKRPRRVMELRFDEAFLTLEKTIWAKLRADLPPAEGAP